MRMSQWSDRLLTGRLQVRVLLGVAIILGGVSERFKELVLKTSDSARGRGFESHPLRHYLNYLPILLTKQYGHFFIIFNVRKIPYAGFFCLGFS